MDSVPEKEKKSNPPEYIQGLAQAEKAISNLDVASAREIYTELSVKYPDKGEAWLGLAKLDFMEDDFEGCARNYNKSYKANPTLGIFHKIADLAMDRPQKLYKLAQSLYRESLYEEAYRFTDRLVEMEISPQMREKVIMLRNELKELIEKQEKELLDQSIKKTEKAYHISFKIIAVIVIIGIAAGLYFLVTYLMKGPTLEEARESYDLAKKKIKSVRRTEMGMDRARTFFKQAEDKLNAILIKHPYNEEAHFLLGKLYLSWRELDLMDDEVDRSIEAKTHLKKAKQEFDRTIDLNKKHSAARIERAAIELEEGGLAKAKDDLQAALKHLNDFTDDIDNRSRLKERAILMLKRVNKEMESQVTKPEKTEKSETPKEELSPTPEKSPEGEKAP